MNVARWPWKSRTFPFSSMIGISAAASWAPRMLYILRNVLLALVEQPQATLLDVPRMLVDEAFRRHVVSHLSDELVREFWRSEFAGWHDRYRTEAIAPIQNRVGQFLTSPLLRQVFAPSKRSLDLRQVMDAGKILLVNLSHGRLGEDSAALLGALHVTAIEQAAKGRADVPEHERRPFFLYADEFQTYASTDSLAIILSQARKYRLSLCLATNAIEAIGDKDMAAKLRAKSEESEQTLQDINSLLSTTTNASTPASED